MFTTFQYSATTSPRETVLFPESLFACSFLILHLFFMEWEHQEIMFPVSGTLWPRALGAVSSAGLSFRGLFLCVHVKEVRMIFPGYP